MLDKSVSLRLRNPSTLFPRKQRLALQPAPHSAPDKSPLHWPAASAHHRWQRRRARHLPVTQRAGLRPTPARLRETLFNWLGHDLSRWRCTDALQASGALGLEATSRGAAQVTLVDKTPRVAVARCGAATAT